MSPSYRVVLYFNRHENGCDASQSVALRTSPMTLAAAESLLDSLAGESTAAGKFCGGDIEQRVAGEWFVFTDEAA